MRLLAGLALLALGLPSPAAMRAAPTAVIIATARGEVSVPVSLERGHPAVPAAPLSRVLPLTATIDSGWADVQFAGQPFRFLLEAPAFVYQGNVVPLAGGAYVARDSLFLPLQWIAGYVPRLFREAYHYDPLAARLEEAGLTPVVRTPTPPARAASAAELALGLHEHHVVTVDAGHGGVDPGNPGMYFPNGITEKDITLAIAKKLRAVLVSKGIGVIMTRTGDTLIDLADRPKYCNGDCDLFVSIHVDALNPAPGYHRANGLQTFFYGRASTANARRVAIMENSAVRYESGGGKKAQEPLNYIFMDLANNEVLRESAVLADLIQADAGVAVPGDNRGVAQANDEVLREALRPAVLVETGFSTNRSDATFLASSAGQQKLADAIADGIVSYLRKYEAKTGVTGASR
jgi:N-acetylmuramoyl-L-alanine amidase